MITDTTDTGLLIEQETDFEEQYLAANFRETNCVVVWLKTGLTPADIVGLKIEKVQK